MEERDRVQEAHQHLDRRARQQQAAAEALNALTPEVIANLKAKEVAGEPAALTAVLEDPHEELKDNHAPQTLEEKLAEALQPVVEAEDQPEIIGIGRFVFQWMLVPSDEEDSQDVLQLALQLQLDEQVPAGFVAEITPEMLAKWSAGKGLQGNRIEHTQFVGALFERAIAVGLRETGGHLIYLLEQLMLEPQPHDSEGNPIPVPTRTSVGEDDPEGVWQSEGVWQ